MLNMGWLCKRLSGLTQGYLNIIFPTAYSWYRNTSSEIPAGLLGITYGNKPVEIKHFSLIKLQLCLISSQNLFPNWKPPTFNFISGKIQRVNLVSACFIITCEIRTTSCGNTCWFESINDKWLSFSRAGELTGFIEELDRNCSFCEFYFPQQYQLQFI